MKATRKDGITKTKRTGAAERAASKKKARSDRSLRTVGEGRKPTAEGKAMAQVLNAAVAPKAVTATDVIHDPELGRKYALYLEHLAGFTSEEIVGYARGMVALLGKELPAEDARRLSVNVCFALNALAERAGYAGSSALLAAAQRTFEIPEGATGSASLSKSARAEISGVIDAFAKKHHITKAATELPAEAYTACREVNRFRRMVEGYDRELTRVWMPQFEPRDWREHLPNNLPQMKDAMERLPLPTQKAARSVLSSTLNEMQRSLAQVASAAKGVNPAIERSANEIIAVLKRQDAALSRA